jgi:hypothetical protein
MDSASAYDYLYHKIYHRKWENEENRAYHNQIRTILGIDNSQIPFAWSREVYELIREIKQPYPHLHILNVKEKLFELKFHYYLPEKEVSDHSQDWIQNKIAQTKLILILKNAYRIPVEQINKLITPDNAAEFHQIKQLYKNLSPDEIGSYRNREPQYKDTYLIEQKISEKEIKASFQYLNNAFPDWQNKLNNSDYSRPRPAKSANLRLQIMLKLATKFSIHPPISIESSEEILLLDKFAMDRTRALFGNDILLQLSLKLYEKGDRDSLTRIQLGEWTDDLKQLELEILYEKEKPILIENVIAFYTIKTQSDPRYAPAKNMIN